MKMPGVGVVGQVNSPGFEILQSDHFITLRYVLRITLHVVCLEQKKILEQPVIMKYRYHAILRACLKNNDTTRRNGNIMFVKPVSRDSPNWHTVD